MMSICYVLILCGIVDDIFVCVESEVEYDQYIINVFDIVWESNVWFNLNNFIVKSRLNVIFWVYVDFGWC